MNRLVIMDTGGHGRVIADLAVKNRDFSAHEISCHFLLESDFAMIIFTADQ